MMTVGSLFAGFGGNDLGLERAGFKTVWQVEKDEYARRVLEKHWPGLRRPEDVREFPPEPASEWECDLICGGFPCQDISAANYRAEGISGERSGLWRDFARILGVLRPRYAIVENVPALTFRGLGTVLGDLAALGFDAEWQTIPANAFGAVHERARIFIVAYSTGQRCQADEVFQRGPFETAEAKQEARLRSWPGIRKPSLALPDRFRWTSDSELCRMVDGVPDGLDRYRGLGNSVVPQVLEWIGRRILTTETSKRLT